MKTTNHTQYSPLLAASDSDYNWESDLTPVSSAGKSSKPMRLVVATLGCVLSTAAISPQFSIYPEPDTIECAANMAQAAQYETLYSIQDELGDWEFCKTLRFSKDGMIHEGDVLLDAYLPSLSNLLQLNKNIGGDININSLPSYAKDLLYEVWESELSDEPLIPGMK